MSYGRLIGTVMLVLALGLASSAVASSGVPTHGPTINGTAEATAEPTHGPTINGTAEATAQPTAKDSAVAPSEEGGFPWGVAVIGSLVALGLIGLAISRSRSRPRTGPAALSQ